MTMECGGNDAALAFAAGAPGRELRTQFVLPE